MEAIVKAVTPRVDESKEYKFLADKDESSPANDSLMQLDDLGFNKSELEEKISTHSLGKVDINHPDKRQEMSWSQSQGQANAANGADAKRVRDQSPSPPHVMPSLLLFSPTPRKQVATITPSERTRNVETRSPSRSVLKLASARSLGASSPATNGPNLTPSADESRFQSVWKFDDDGKMVRADSADNESVLMKDIDLIQALKEGTVLLKFGARGQPHFRFFVVNSSLDTLIWMSGTKSFESTQIPVAAINDIKFGLGEKALKVKGAKAYQNLGFTVVYNDWQNTLELMAKDSEELQVWVNGLIALHNAARQGVRAPTTFNMAVSTNVDRHIIFGKSVNGGAQATPAEISKLERKFNKLAAEAEVVVVPFGDVVTDRVGAYLKQLKNNAETSENMAEMNYQLWMLGVQIEALENILRTPREATPRPIVTPVSDIDN